MNDESRLTDGMQMNLVAAFLLDHVTTGIGLFYQVFDWICQLRDGDYADTDPSINHPAASGRGN